MFLLEEKTSLNFLVTFYMVPVYRKRGEYNFYFYLGVKFSFVKVNLKKKYVGFSREVVELAVPNWTLEQGESKIVQGSGF